MGVTRTAISAPAVLALACLLAGCSNDTESSDDSPYKSHLEFRIAPTTPASGALSLTTGEYEHYIHQFSESKGPDAPAMLVGTTTQAVVAATPLPAPLPTMASGPARYKWFPVHQDTPLGPELVTISRNGQKYVLLFDIAGFTMLRGDWRLSAQATTDEQGKPRIRCTLDTQAKRLMSAFSGNHKDDRLAVLVDDQVLMIARIKERLTDQVEVTGEFTAEEARAMCRGLNFGSGK
jgi:hypothetical protein